MQSLQILEKKCDSGNSEGYFSCNAHTTWVAWRTAYLESSFQGQYALTSTSNSRCAPGRGFETTGMNLYRQEKKRKKKKNIAHHWSTYLYFKCQQWMQQQMKLKAMSKILGFCFMSLASYNNKKLRFIPQAQIVLTGMNVTGHSRLIRNKR